MAKQFQNHPLQFVLERDLQFDLLVRLSRQASSEGESLSEIRRSGKGDEQHAETGPFISGQETAADYKRRYLSKIEEKLETGHKEAYAPHDPTGADTESERPSNIPPQMPRIRPEVAVPAHSDRRNNEEDEGEEESSDITYIDLGIFRTNSRPEVNWNDGSIRFIHDSHDVGTNEAADHSLQAAIEIKYIKNKNVFPAGKSDKEIPQNPGQASIDSYGDFVKTDSNSIQSDLNELQSLAEHGVDGYLVIFSNYNHMYLDRVYDSVKKDGDIRSRTEDYLRRGELIECWLDDQSRPDSAVDGKQSSGSISILYIHPLGYRAFGPIHDSDFGELSGENGNPELVRPDN
jgi:hypothetical protein